MLSLTDALLRGLSRRIGRDSRPRKDLAVGVRVHTQGADFREAAAKVDGDGVVL